MKTTVITPAELTPELHAAWCDIQSSCPEFDNPYFRPEFTAGVAQVRSDVEIGVLHDSHGRISGFFPFQRSGRRRAKPVGGRLSDYQAVIARPDFPVDPRRLMQDCGLVAWDFDHLLVSQRTFHPFHYATDSSPYLDLSGGYEAYCRVRGEMGDAELKQTARKARKLAREVGPLRLELQCDEPWALECLLRWKSAQYQRTRITDVFSFPWTGELIRYLLTLRDPAFRGLLSVLYAGDRPAAVHFGMWSHGVLHYWFPTYDVELGGYSPGRVLLLEMIRQCAPFGLRKLDLGRGLASYKTRMMTGTIDVAMGSVDLRPISSLLRQRWRRTQDWIRSSPLRQTARIPGRVLYQVREWLEFK
jgi:CelD/BcsL family acetyltransferase involved in cellulose biosynthesis